MAENVLCEYCDLDSGLGAVDGEKGGIFNDIFAPIWDMLVSLVSSLIEILMDVIVWAFCGLAEGMLYIANTLNFPDVVNGLQVAFNNLDPVVGYLLYKSGIFESLLIVGGGMSFYVIRKLVTLGKW